MRISPSFEVRLPDKRLQFSHWHALLVALLALRHGLLDDSCDFLSSLSQDLVHVLCHWVHITKVFEGRLSSLGVGVQ